MAPADTSGSARDSFHPVGERTPAGQFRDISRLQWHRALVALALLGLVTRALFFLEHAANPSFGVPTLDQKYYDLVARMLVNGEDLRELNGFRPLLYPMFLAVFYKLGGGWGVDLALLMQHMLGIMTGLIVAFMGAMLLRNRLAGILGGALYLLAPVPLYFEGELLIESSYTFMICLALLVHLHATRTSGLRAGAWWFSCGALVGLAAQGRANILVFLAVYPLFTAWRCLHSRTPASFTPLIGLPGALIMMTVWGCINMRQSETFHLMPNAGGVNLYLGNKRGADGMLVGQDVIESLSTLSRQTQGNAAGGGMELSGAHYQDLVEVWARVEYEADMRSKGREPEAHPMAISRYWTGRTRAEIMADPLAWMRLVARKCWLMLWNTEVPNNKDFAFLQTEFFMLRWLPVRWVILLMLAPAGLWAAARLGRHDSLLILLIYAAFYSAGNVAFFVCDRYRYPVWPVMAVFAGAGVLAIMEWARLRDMRRLRIAGVASVLMATLSLVNWFGAKIPNFAQDYYFRSSAWFEKGRFDEALADIQRSLQLDPLNSGALHHQGNVLFALGRMDEARDSYERALKIVPGDSGVWNNLGAALESLGNLEGALSAFVQAAQGRLPSRNAFLGKAFVQMRLGRLREADATLEQLGQSERTASAEALAARSILAQLQGDAAAAAALREQATRLDPDIMEWAAGRAGLTR